MNRLIVLALVVVTACGNARKDKCEAIRDRMLEEGPKLIAKALPEIDPARRDEMQKQGEQELAQVKARFVAACMADDKLDFACLESQEKASHPSPECKGPLDQLWKAVYE